MEAKDRIILALDVSSATEVRKFGFELTRHVGMFKIGLQLLMSVGAPEVVRILHDFGCKVFLDGKFNDIPNTVGEASAAAAALGVEMFNVHASAGVEAMRAAVANKGTSKVLAVTVLTSIDDDMSLRIFGAVSKITVSAFAKDAQAAGVDGIICSPKELDMLSELPLLKVTPGVRPTWADANDQKRVMTPEEAIVAGADYLVIGRPITKPPQGIGSPADAARRIAEEIEAGLARRTP